MVFAGKALVHSIKERCRVCYTCVRECPAKAIRIAQGQAEVIAERCIGCGNCFRVCSRNAKEVLSTVDNLKELFTKEKKVSAIIAPSFPVEFTDLSVAELVYRLKRMGFTSVHEVAFGADLVAEAYKKLLNDNTQKRYIATTCPAIVAYVEKYEPELVNLLAPVISPMVAMARVVKRLYGEESKIVFIGPCIAKKAEEDYDEEIKQDVDLVLTFSELRSLFNEQKINKEEIEKEGFDPPYAGKGRVFPLARGLLETANIKEDLLVGDIVATDGRDNFPEAIEEFKKGDVPVRLLEVLSCKGCIMGAGISHKNMSLFERRAAVGRYARNVKEIKDEEIFNEMFKTISFTRKFKARDQRLPDPSTEQIREVLARMGKFTEEDELNCGACGYETCKMHAIAISRGIAESEMCLPYVIDQLKKSLEEIAATKNALMQSEKLASMGQLAAGVAHEVNNPLGVVLMYAHLLLEEYGENEKLKDDLKIITEQANRCKRIVSGLLNFARQSKTICQPVDIVKLAKETVKTVKFPENIKVEIISDLKDRIAEIDREQIAQVFVNLFTNAIDAMPEGGKLTIKLYGDEETISFDIEDTGTGIPEENLSKIFEPFFTTKQIGKGTGLGLAVLYGIVKMHRGNVIVKSNNNPDKGPTGTTFTIKLPRKEIKII